MTGPYAGVYTDGDVDTNRSDNPEFRDILKARISRRSALRGGVATSATFLLPAVLAGCGGGSGQDSSIQTIGTNRGDTSSGAMFRLNATISGLADYRNIFWTQLTGPAVVLDDAASASASFIAPAVAEPTELQFQFSGQNGDRTALATVSVMVAPARLGFAAVAKSLSDQVTVPAGYDMAVLYRLGDPIASGVSTFRNDGTDADMDRRIGDHGDALYYFGLAAAGSTRDDTSNTRGLLVQNFENITQRNLHAAGPTTIAGARPEAEALKEMQAHGVGVVEVARGTSGAWSYVQNSALNRRITPQTPMAFSGPVRGSALLQTRHSPAGTDGRGTLNNCANGYTPWGTLITCEENWAGYFRRRAATDDAQRSARELVALARYGVSSTTGSYSWATVVPADSSNTLYARLTAEVSAAAATGDFRNEANHFGWVVELDPYDPAAAPRKRTALGRMAHEGAWPGRRIAGVRPAFYMGDDARGEYIYKFVSAQPWVAADAERTDRLAVGDKYLDQGTLYVARFNADGSGQWLPLVFGQGQLTAANATYAFASQADVLVNTRLAADALGATKMDRPEWTAVNPLNGEMYCTLTNNSATLRPLAGTDAANPRHYNDPRTTGTAQRGNPNGHIIRLREANDSTEATAFTWDVYLFGANSDADAANVNLSGLTADNDFSSPDGLWFSRPSNAGGQVNPLLWIQTDDGAYTDVTNCMLLVAQAGRVGDGGTRTILNADATGATRAQTTIVGRAAGSSVRRFLVGPKECEITGIDTTPDGRTLFVGIQHPGEDTAGASSWPDGGSARPRSAVVVITRSDGGVVGLS